MIWLFTLAQMCWAAGAPDPEALKAQFSVCGRLDANREKARAAAEGDTPSPCRAQITASLASCAKPPTETKEDAEGALSQLEVATTDFQLTLQKQLAAFNAGQLRFKAAAAQCDDEQKMVDQACGNARDDLKTSLRDNGRADAEAQTTLTEGGAGVGPVNRARAQATADTGRLLQAQMLAADRARRAATVAITESKECFVYQSDAYARAITASEAQIAQTTALPDANTAETNLVQSANLSSTGAGTVVAPPANPPTTYASLTSRGSEVAVSALGVVGGHIGTPVNVVVSAETGDYWGAAQNGAGVASAFVESRALGLVGGLPGAVALGVMSPKDAGTACDGDTRNPVEAGMAGCAVNLNGGRALSILRSP